MEFYKNSDKEQIQIHKKQSKVKESRDRSDLRIKRKEVGLVYALLKGKRISEEYLMGAGAGMRGRKCIVSHTNLFASFYMQSCITVLSRVNVRNLLLYSTAILSLYLYPVSGRFQLLNLGRRKLKNLDNSLGRSGRVRPTPTRNFEAQSKPWFVAT